MTAITNPGALQGYKLTTVTFEDVASLDGETFGFRADQPYAGLGLTLRDATVAAHTNLASSSGGTAARSAAIYVTQHQNSLWWQFTPPQSAVGFYYRDSLATSFTLQVYDHNYNVIETDTFPGGEGYAGVIRTQGDIRMVQTLAPHATYDDALQSRTYVDDISFGRALGPGMLMFVTTLLAWAWMIVTGTLIITPGGVFCIVCGMTPNVPGYIGRPVVTLIAIGSIVIGILGFATMKTLRAGRR